MTEIVETSGAKQVFMAILTLSLSTYRTDYILKKMQTNVFEGVDYQSLSFHRRK